MDAWGNGIEKIFLFFQYRCLLLGRLNADSRTLSRVRIGVRSADGFDFVVVLGVLCGTAVYIGDLGYAVRDGCGRKIAAIIESVLADTRKTAAYHDFVYTELKAT